MARMAHHAESGGLGGPRRPGTPGPRPSGPRPWGRTRRRCCSSNACCGTPTTPRRSSAHALLATLSYEQYVTGRVEEALAARRQALRIWQSVGDVEEIGRQPALDVAAELVRRLRTTTPMRTPSRPGRRWPGEARAGGDGASNRAQLCMLAGDLAGTREWAGRALALASSLEPGRDVEEVEVHALTNIGTAENEAGHRETGVRLLTESLDRSLAADLHEHAARAFTCRVSTAVRQHRRAEAEEFLERGLAYCVERDLDAWDHYLRSFRCRHLLERGDLEQAAPRPTGLVGHVRGLRRQPDRCAERPGAGAGLDRPAATRRGRWRSRCGWPRAHARRSASRSPSPPRARSRGSAAPRRGGRAGRRGLGRRPARRQPVDPRRGRHLAARRTCAAGVELDGTPYVAEVAGDWEGAAAQWERAGQPVRAGAGAGPAEARATGWPRRR